MANYWVVPASSGRWVVKREGAPAPEEVEPDGYDAMLEIAVDLSASSGGGVVVVIDGRGETIERRVADRSAGAASEPVPAMEGALQRARRRRQPPAAR